MPRRNTQGSGNPETGAVGLMEPGSASSPVEVRPGALVSPQAGAYHFFGTNQVGFENQLVRYQSGSSFPLAFQPEVLNL